MRRFRALPALALATLTLTACPVNPATGERQLMLISEAQEIEMGRQGAQQVEVSLGLYDNPDLQEYVSQVGLDLAANSEKPDLPWSFKIVDDLVVNAFALPGGFIFVTRGILTHFNSEAELSLGLLFLKFGRDDERQSDDLGFRYMRRSGYDPTEMVDVFEMLGRVSAAAGGGGLPAWMSTHPDPGERRERMEQRLAEAGGESGGEVERTRYLQMIDGLVFGENPRNGFFRGSTFLHPDLKFRIDLPAEWTTQNMTQQVVALSPNEDALIQLTLAEESSVRQAADTFFAQSGIQVGRTSNWPVNGLPARAGYFSATASDGTEFRGLAVFIEYGKLVYKILGYTLADRWSTYADSFGASFGSFDRLTERAALNAQPARLEIVRLDRSMTLAQFAERYPSTADIETLELINGVGAGETIASGEFVKRVVGGTIPKE
jgi:predicted Zn-dependent protease